MSSQPRPADLAKYQARLGELNATREIYRSDGNQDKVRATNRLIQAQMKWIKRAMTKVEE
jgi:hypothetical protein